MNTTKEIKELEKLIDDSLEKLKSMKSIKKTDKTFVSMINVNGITLHVNYDAFDMFAGVIGNDGFVSLYTMEIDDMLSIHENTENFIEYIRNIVDFDNNN